MQRIWIRKERKQACFHMVAAEGLTCKTPSGDVLRVREVWQENLEEEMELIRDLVDEYPFLAMDTEFPGIVARPVGNFKNSGEYHYQTLRHGAFTAHNSLCTWEWVIWLALSRQSPLSNLVPFSMHRWLSGAFLSLQVQRGHAETHSAWADLLGCRGQPAKVWWGAQCLAV